MCMRAEMGDRGGGEEVLAHCSQRECACAWWANLKHRVCACVCAILLCVCAKSRVRAVTHGRV
jgi:hypothetical protein